MGIQKITFFTIFKVCARSQDFNLVNSLMILLEQLLCT
ncbi:hypothetical protein N44_00556 [Microcystis aeruginosa NIES-44]|uniref:Uncharacterized protein n=1 Tax=Microcystis aeruginosa NIES-44 TaxID=449439 RepID=A0A0A1VNK1_MICAE|nr:hypothetical protein N44_00556 [Microcystis aeruginosa NIES-44]